MMDYKVSVIIPVYNAEESLDNTIKSVLNQSIGFENIELILVDDLSSDGSKRIIESYCNKFDNIVSYFSKKNHGAPGFGRNMGLKLATSNYIMFLDNDDEYAPDICEKLYDTIITKEVDLVCCNRITIDPISNLKESILYENGIEYDDYVLIENDDILLFDSLTVWNKIFRKEIIEENNLQFLENTHADDIAFTLDYYLKSKTLIYLKNYYGIYWNVYEDSLSHAVSIKYVSKLLDAYYYVFNKLKKENKDKYVGLIFKYKVSLFIFQCSYLKSTNEEFKDILMQFKNFEEEIGFNEKFDEKWLAISNKLILSNHFTTTIVFLKFINAIRKITIFRRINRRITFEEC